MSSSYRDEQTAPASRLPINLIVTGIVLVVLLLGGGLVGCPAYSVYSASMRGKAQLAEADASKQVAVQTAKAKAESAIYEKQAEITRAEGAAAAIKITGVQLQQNPEYLRYLYVQNLAESHDQIIYVPTEGGMPILEAGRGASINSNKLSPSADATSAK